MYIHPNQGIQSSGWNALRVGLVAGLGPGLIVGLGYGGLDYLLHYFLRYALWSAKVVPWNYSRFLDYAAERILLHKVGGGYIFVHRLLLDYFASLDTAPTFTERTGQL